MPGIKKYQPHCPARNCSGGHGSRLHQVTAGKVNITQEVLSRRKSSDVIYRCSYCGFVWFQSSTSFPGFNPTPAGFYDNFQNPNVFIPIPEFYPIRDENTAEYWANRREKRQKVKTKKR
jgi:hypothetical protein